jgi:hypothetical protein
MQSHGTAFADRVLPAPLGGGFAMADYWVWCGSVIKGEDSQYHMFASRWPKHYPFFAGYIAYSEVVRAVAATPTGPYTFQEVVLPTRGECYWDGRMTHNPTIHRYGDTYMLFYIGSTYEGDAPSAQELANHQLPLLKECYSRIRIGLATAPSVLGPWQRLEHPILEPRPGKWDSSIVTNPAPCVLADGSILLYYRSNTSGGLRIGAARAPGWNGPYERMVDEPVLQLFEDNFVEDPYVWQVGEHFELIAKDMTGGLTGEKHAGVHATSSDGLQWAISNPPKAYSRRITWEDGTTSVQGALERPQLLMEGGQPTHLCAATGDGPGGFRNCTKTWSIVLPLR